MRPSGTVRRSTAKNPARSARTKRAPGKSKSPKPATASRLSKKLALAVKKAEAAGTYAGLRGLSLKDVTTLYEVLLDQLAKAKDSDERGRIKEKLASLTYGS